MKLFIIGASGKVGKVVVAEALAAGHTVVALARNPAKLGLTHANHANLTIVRGDVFDEAGLTAAITASHPDAVISAFGQVPPKRKDLMRVAIPIIARSCVAGGAGRLIFLAGSIWHVEGDQPDAVMSGFTAVLHCCLCSNTWGPGGDFSVGLASLMTDFPQLDWTVVRPPNISGGPSKARSPTDLKVGPVATCGGDIRRVDLARWMIDPSVLARDGPLKHGVPTLSNN